MVRLDEIKNALDELNNSGALQQVNTFLKKNKDNAEAKALKALALLRLQRMDEADAILSELRSESQDDVDLQALLICYRENGRYEEICDIYQKKYDANPDDLEIAAQYFMSLVRINRLEPLFTVAMRMHKSDKATTTYYFWAVMALYLQGRELQVKGDKMGATLKLTVARRCVEKAIADTTFKMAREGLALYTLILRAMGDYSAIADVIQTDKEGGYRDGEGALFAPGRELDELHREVFLNLHQYDNLWDLGQRLIKEDPNNWAGYDAVMTAGINKKEFAQVARCFSALYRETVDAVPAKRAPFLACLVWHKKCAESAEINGVGEGFPAVHEVLLAFFEAFGAKRSFFSDCKPYLSLLPDITQFLAECDAFVTQKCADEDQWRVILRETALAAIACATGVNGGDAKEDVFASIKEKYGASKKAGEELKDSELQYGDDYVQLLTHYALRDGTDASLVESLTRVVEEAVGLSKSNPQLRLILVKLLIAQGDLVGAVSHWDALEVKQIQFDSIGYVLFDHLIRNGGYEAAQRIYAEARRFFQSGDSDVPEYLCRAYKHGSFHKIEEFSNFYTKLKSSLQNCACTCDSFLLNLTRSKFTLERMQSICHYTLTRIPDADKMASSADEALSDNSQLDVMIAFEPAALAVTDSDKALLRKSRFQYTMMRYWLVHCVHALLNNFRKLSTAADTLEAALEAVRDVTAEVEAAAKANAFGVFTFGICSPRAVFCSALELETLGVLLNFLKAAAKIRPFLASKSRGQQMKDECASILSDLKTGVEASFSSASAAVEMEDVHSSMEVGSIVSLALGVLEEGLQSESILAADVASTGEVVQEEIKVNKVVKQKLKALIEGVEAVQTEKAALVAALAQTLADKEQDAATASAKAAFKNFRGILKSGCYSLTK